MSYNSQLHQNAELIGIKGSRSLLSTPALILDLDKMEKNISYFGNYMREHKHGFRPVAKIHKCVKIAKRQIESGALGVSCATLAEAEIMSEAGIKGVLLFSTIVSKGKIRRLINLNARSQGFILAVDNKENITAIAEAANSVGTSIDMLLDIEIGGKRTGISDPRHVVTLAKYINKQAGSNFIGLQAYNGSFQTTTNYADRLRLQSEATETLSNVLLALNDHDIVPEVVSGGGTGTYAIDCYLGKFTESQAGTYIFLDTNYMNTHFEETISCPFEKALTVATSVISTSSPDYIITDAGLKEFSREHLAPQIITAPAIGYDYELVGDDLGKIITPRDLLRPKIGDILECLTPHCYATLNLYTVYHCVRNDTLVDIWSIDARDQS